MTAIATYTSPFYSSSLPHFCLLFRTITFLWPPILCVLTTIQSTLFVCNRKFQDGTAPGKDVVARWLELNDEVFFNSAGRERCIAVHCVSGIGRAPVIGTRRRICFSLFSFFLVASYLLIMSFFLFSADGEHDVLGSCCSITGRRRDGSIGKSFFCPFFAWRPLRIKLYHTRIGYPWQLED